MPNTLRAVDKRLKENSSPNFAIGDKLTVTDFGLTTVIYTIFLNESFEYHVHFKACFEGFPHLKAYAETMKENHFKEYLANRPVRPW